MRRILVDHARRQAARKRGDGAQRVPLEETAETAAPSRGSGAALDHALARLEQLDRELAQIVELRAFGGLTIDEAGARAEGVAVDGQAGVANRESVADARARRPEERGRDRRVTTVAAMTDDRWLRVRRLFEAAVEQPPVRTLRVPVGRNRGR